MYKNQTEAYNNQQIPVEGNPTQSEAWALMQAALKLRDAKISQNSDEMKAAVRLNLRLWTIFQADLLSPTCEVPQEIRQNVLSLANFVDKWSMEFMSDPDASKIDVLININREISGGLTDGAKNEAAGPQSTESPDISSSNEQPETSEQPVPVGGFQNFEA